ncbi:MAG: SGNH/GDSL hydrolase family protein, partial [Verrucomicrobiae bacterium]|nr:SGNH/GDSL hydrolase family protein [Verrucomicrobiae bacterium]
MLTLKIANFRLLLFSCLLPIGLLGKLDLKDGDSFVFLGDSITHRGPYSQYIETFYVTRYPERRISFMNAGISGDKAGDALARFEEDVAAFKPDYVSVMLGMNDGQYLDFSQEIFGTYREDMDKVLGRIEEIGAVPIVISPTIFDQQQYTLRCQDPEFRFIRLHASDHYNGTMALFGAWGRERAMAEKWDYVNFWGPLNDLTVDQRKEDPQFTFVEDAIHPGPIGHAIMAHAFLEEVEPDRRIVSAVTARMQNGKWRVTGRNAAISEVKGSEDTLTFTVKAASLPWVLPEEARPGYELSKSG